MEYEAARFMKSLINIRIWKFQLFSSSTWWLGFGRFSGAMGEILKWDIGLGYMRLRKWK